jgi:hypothetical protein
MCVDILSLYKGSDTKAHLTYRLPFTYEIGQVYLCKKVGILTVMVIFEDGMLKLLIINRAERNFIR